MSKPYILSHPDLAQRIVLAGQPDEYTRRAIPQGLPDQPPVSLTEQLLAYQVSGGDWGTTIVVDKPLAQASGSAATIGWLWLYINNYFDTFPTLETLPPVFNRAEIVAMPVRVADGGGNPTMATAWDNLDYVPHRPLAYYAFASPGEIDLLANWYTSGDLGLVEDIITGICYSTTQAAPRGIPIFGTEKVNIYGWENIKKLICCPTGVGQTILINLFY